VNRRTLRDTLIDAGALVPFDAMPVDVATDKPVLAIDDAGKAAALKEMARRFRPSPSDALAAEELLRERARIAVRRRTI
jgi:hypothetical protein